MQRFAERRLAMNAIRLGWALFITILLTGLSTNATALPPEREQLSVAVTEPDIAAIVAAVGGNEVEMFSLFKGCIFRENLQVEPGVKDRLTKSNVIVWTGFLNESAAIAGSMGATASTLTKTASTPTWIDVSKGAARTNVPTSNCDGYVDPKLVKGDPFFWLNPNNGAIIARNIAEGLGSLRPQKRAYFLANASTFKAALEKDIARWKEDLHPLRGLRVFSAQCGWKNFAKLGGPAFAVCKGTPGVLPTPDALVEQVKELKAQVVIVDPNTPSEYGEALRERSGVKVIEVASSIEKIPGASSYSAVFDNMVRALQAAAKTE
jgi:ABC-type Zn uptake system ZnuABC Zn-binding protein ZnuA